MTLFGGNDILNSTSRLAVQLAFQISPILFTNGIAGNSFGMLPVVSLLDSGWLSLIDLDQAFAHFTVLPGGKLANYSVGMYPFANQTVAANAIIAEPTNLSVRMHIPVKGNNTYLFKLSQMTSIQAAIQQHANLGGTYTVATPAFIYQNLILTGLTDVTSDGVTPQNTWQWDFVQPLVTLQQAQAAQSTLMSKLTAGLPTDGSFAADASSSALPSLTTGTTAAGAGVPAGILGSALSGITSTLNNGVNAIASAIS
jgi:hypothetical protein